MNFKKKVAFFTLGCKVNQYETESIKKSFIERGYVEEKFENSADIYIVNSCTVTSIADRKTRNMLRRAKKINPKSTVVVTGCYAQTNSKDLEKIEEIDMIIGNDKKNKIVEIIEDSNEEVIVGNIFNENKYLELNFSTYREMTRAYIKIQDGCENFCSYCKIPFARGKNRSRKLENIIKEVKLLADSGYKEIILIGINLGAYGEDFEEKIKLEDVIEKVSRIDGIERIRLGSIYPDKISDRFIDILKNNKKLMNHLHISLQSGDDKVLNLMKRKYNAKEAIDVLKKIKREIPEIAFSGDVIVGFPQEEEKNFENTYNFIKEIGFSDLHIFPYSDRENSLATSFTGKISSLKKKERAKKLEELREKMFLEFREKYIGKEVDVLIEKIDNVKNIAEGYTKNYLKVEIEANNVNDSFKVNDIVKTKIKKIKKGMLIGGPKKEED
ncbi:tRNA (N(6)-L-threonylcarbamoyladenosine(37)-C(2))-methylthiotransferase MtaB [Haliovirga abyssi]|uniref:Threonylcarbamoyladenosine tRNA methylthiotransferase MtaB n=1 Tax=Haliovirga abyssi TaxID=2996794 RepID=A0AAU9DGR3_9FUSO|nr:tRNA (N(6)-L-threonylcarbamoyladenosine(37)-C(2))-methylthiotransferase MtaB [Haliovirga abyssi]BDU49889.1 tRNA (N(6)-L-threonylcarbamoyladenosine(37)-C(2))-methylthiotransferase MtaB [Haliovirga abyssi]